MTPVQNSNNRDKHLHATAYFYGSTGEYKVVSDGKEYTRQEFNKAFPVDGFEVKPDLNLKGENSDGTKRWMKH